MNRTIAKQLRLLADARAAGDLPGRGFRAAAYLRAAINAESEKCPDLRTLDHAGVCAALGCGDKIAALVLEMIRLDRVLTLVESGEITGAVALAAQLGDEVPEAMAQRVRRALVSLQSASRQRAIRWLAMATAAVLAERRGQCGRRYEAWASLLNESYPSDTARARDLDETAQLLAHDMAMWALANPGKVGWPPAVEPPPVVRLQTRGGRVLGVVDGGLCAGGGQ